MMSHRRSAAPAPPAMLPPRPRPSTMVPRCSRDSTRRSACVVAGSANGSRLTWKGSAVSPRYSSLLRRLAGFRRSPRVAAQGADGRESRPIRKGNAGDLDFPPFREGRGLGSEGDQGSPAGPGRRHRCLLERGQRRPVGDFTELTAELATVRAPALPAQFHFMGEGMGGGRRGPLTVG